MESDTFKIRKCDHSDDCEACIKGKMSRKRFPKEAAAVNEPMECIVSDVCGPIQVESLGGKRYFVSFIDIFSGYCQLFFIRERGEVAGVTVECMEHLMTQTGGKVKTLRTDRGTEYLGERLQSCLRKEGINFECTVGCAPEQNGIAEGRNRTLMEATRSMLAESGLGKGLWAEAADTANFVFDRMVDGGTKEGPYEKMFGKKPRLPSNEEYRRMIGMLLYLSTKTRPDIAAGVTMLSQGVSKPRDCDWNEVRRMTRYLKATREMRLRLNKRGMDNDLQIFSDASWARDGTDRRSNSGCLCRVNGGAVSWSCKKQGLVTLSSMESEYVALTEACKEVQ
jgi:transposase InsO family protein